MNKIICHIYSISMLSLAFTAQAYQDPHDETHVEVTGFAQDESESKAHDQAIADCMKQLNIEKGKCESGNGSYREVVCGIKCENKMNRWECRANGTAFCHKKT